ncbi:MULTISPECIES: LysR family transcriptional regulator [Pseudomonas]|uniref:LysR family transcriptional regulator n=1 Tax=Pseudomonas TaxID=286 RepID=UPI0019155A5C|nr:MULTISPECIES: LysR family transcriptional regulator [Pseudomonas]
MNLLLAFDALLREGSVTKAADQLGLTQSAMSHALRRLRDFYADPLFVRVGDVMRPTPYAEGLAPLVLEIISTVRVKLMTQASFDPATSRRVFSFCMSDMGELVFLPRLIERLRSIAPHCRIRTIQAPSEKIAACLESGDADLALGSPYLEAPELFRQELFPHTFACIVSHKSTMTQTDFTIERFLSMQHVSVTLSDRSGLYDRAIDEGGVKRDIYLTTPHFLMVPMILENNPTLVATVPRELARVFERYNAVRMLEPPMPLPKFSLRQYWHPRHHHDPANIWLRQMTKELFDNFMS